MFETQNSPRFGNCFSFNANYSGNKDNTFTSSLPGSVMGLNVVLNIQQSSYMKNGLTASAWARVSVEDARLRALVDEFGMDVEPNKATNFAIEKVNSWTHPLSLLWL